MSKGLFQHFRVHSTQGDTAQWVSPAQQFTHGFWMTRHIQQVAFHVSRSPAARLHPGQEFRPVLPSPAPHCFHGRLLACLPCPALRFSQKSLVTVPEASTHADPSGDPGVRQGRKRTGDRVANAQDTNLHARVLQNLGRAA